MERKLKLLSVGTAVTVVLVGNNPPNDVDLCAITADPRAVYAFASRYGLTVSPTAQARLARFTVPMGAVEAIYSVPIGLVKDFTELIVTGAQILQGLTDGSFKLPRLVRPLRASFVARVLGLDASPEEQGILVAQLGDHGKPVAKILHSQAQGTAILEELSARSLDPLLLLEVAAEFAQLPPTSTTAVHVLPDMLAQYIHLALMMKQTPVFKLARLKKWRPGPSVVRADRLPSPKRRRPKAA